MATHCYKEIRLSPDKIAVIKVANTILREYEEQGFDLTLRQLYYQFVARGLIPNNLREYKNLGNAINDGRLAGWIDWDHIVDRTRNVHANDHWDSPVEIVKGCSQQYQIDKWVDQKYRIMVMIEKDALLGLIQNICRGLDVPYLSCRGYMSQSEMREIAVDRLIPFEEQGQINVILHLGDHDPSGVDMTRDIQDRLQLFGSRAIVIRIALTPGQIQQFNPPPNPVKLTDSRSSDYVKEHGQESSELDALSPTVIADLITRAVKKARDEKKWRAQVKAEAEQKAQLGAVAERWDEVRKLVAE